MRAVREAATGAAHERWMGMLGRPGDATRSGAATRRAILRPPAPIPAPDRISFGARRKEPTCAREKGPTPRSQLSLAAADA